MLKEVNRQPISISTLYGEQACTLTWHINSLISQPSVWYASKAPRISKCVHKIMMQIWFMQQSCTNFERDWCDILKNPNKCHSLSAWQNTPKHYWGKWIPSRELRQSMLTMGSTWIKKWGPITHQRASSN